MINHSPLTIARGRFERDDPSGIILTNIYGKEQIRIIIDSPGCAVRTRAALERSHITITPLTTTVRGVNTYSMYVTIPVLLQEPSVD